MNEHPSPEFERELRETLNAPNANPVFVRDLRATLLERSMMKNRTRSFPRLAWGFSLAFLIALLVVASPRAAAALKQLLGYIPGVGFVESSETLRILAEPVDMEKNGIQVTVENGTADLQRTTLLLRIEGYMPLEPEIFCDDQARIVLPDGTSLKVIRYEYSSESGKDAPNGVYSARYEFEALPAGQLDAKLEIPCLLQNPNQTDFNLPLQFRVADAEDITPVLALPTADTANPASPSSVSNSSADSNIEGFSIVLESETSLDDGYILTGSYQWSDPRFDGFSVYPFEQLITDANGEAVDFEPVDPGTYNSDPAVKKIPFAFHVIGRNHVFPLKISVNSVTVNLPDTANFQFDPGADPQVGQSWDVNLDVPVAGHVIRVQTIQVIAGRTPAELGFKFAMTGDAGVMGAVVQDADPEIPNMGGGGGGGGSGGGISSQFEHGWTIEGYSPAGVKTFVITDVTVSIDGTWQLEWQPAAQ